MMEVRDYWAAVVRGWWLLVVLGLVGLAVGLLVASPPKGHIETHYQSTSVIGSPPTSQNGPSLIGGGITIGQILYYASTDSVISQTSTLSGLNEPLPQVRGQITVLSPSTGNSGQSNNNDQNGVVNVSTVGATAAQALALNTGFVDALNTYTNDQAKSALVGEEKQTEATLYTVLTDIADNNFVPGLTAQALEVQVSALQTYLASLVIEQPGSGLQVVQAPSAASTVAVVTGTPTVVDNRTLRAAAGLMIGLILGILAALALWLLDRRLKTAKRAQVALGYPVVAEISFESSDSTEAYRMLWLTVFREPLPLPPMEQNERWYDGEDPVLDHGVGSRSGQAGGP
jgi:bifunctional DNase/RNase